MHKLHRRNHYELKSEINIVPLLDVLLVLLLVFMATEPFITQSVEVSLPHSTESQVLNTSDDPLVIIEVSNLEKYTMVVEKDRIVQLSSEQIISKARKFLSINPKTIFLIGGARDVPYNEIIKALSLLQNAGVKSVGLMTRPI